ncbi:hypothetical protein GDO86_015645 [Hymenochirus boettgeri]|uniref:G-patch domain-containing protein n=1 Tax=Hymenochirus boettgeri TaxID=247094 RepID=A0A8T2JZ43_9PIPI|nr:hypothetical protein GDO86_015645 [Hymenochirus boettgeri]
MKHVQLISFTKAQEKSDFWENGEYSKKKSPCELRESLTGAEARNFYEGLLSTEAQESVSKKSSHSKNAARSEQLKDVNNQDEPSIAEGPIEHRRGHQLLRCSQEGDLKGLKRLIEKEKCNINFRDTYYWTAIMCAAYAGRKEAVEYLLKRGAAWVGVCETQGRDALTLAEEAGHTDVVHLIQASLISHPQENIPRTRPQEKRYCKTCNTHYQEDSVETHERSTVHLFNNRKKHPATYYAIPDHNIGFKMMVKDGWDRETGLGPEGAGRKFPIKTVLKRDLKGIGFHKDKKPKVTHFSANDLTAVANSQLKQRRSERISTISRKEEKRKEAKEKTWERNLRTYMNIDL